MLCQMTIIELEIVIVIYCNSLSGIWNESAWECSLFKRREKNGFQLPLLCLGKLQINAKNKSRTRVLKSVRHDIQTCSSNFCNDTGAKQFSPLPFLWTTSVAWIEEMCCMGNC